MSRIRNVALLLLVLALAAGLASAQPTIRVTQVTNGSASQTYYDPTSGPASKSPRAGNYWDAQIDTNYFTVPAYINAPPNPQVAVGPDDILTVANRVLYRFPNPNALGNSAVTNPYNNPPTSQVFADVWLGITDLNTVCPTVNPSRTNFTCVIDNLTMRYDQLQGRYVVVFTATDVPQHMSSWVLIVSKSAQLNQGAPNSTQVFTPPIAPIVGGTATGGQNSNWVRYIIPINVVLTSNTASNAGTFCVTPNANAVVPNAGQFPGSNLTLPQVGTPATALGPITSGCTDYYPTGARIGLDNDNIILTAPVLDMSQAPFAPFNDVYSGPVTAGTSTQATEIGFTPVTPLQNQVQLPGGPYAGTRVTLVQKMAVYNGAAATSGVCSSTTCPFINLSDDILTGTLTGTGAGSPLNTFTGGGPNLSPASARVGPTAAAGVSPWCLMVQLTGGTPAVGTPAAANCNPLPPLFWEPDNLRGRALASYDAQVGIGGGPTAGVITPLDYLVGTIITDNFGNSAGLVTPAFFTTFYVQPIITQCPGGAIAPAQAGLAVCGVQGAGQTPETALLGVLNVGTTNSCFNGSTSTGPCQAPRSNEASIAITSDPGLVGQSTAQSTTAQSSNDGTSMLSRRLFVGDQRPQQLIFREGLLYIARTIRLYDTQSNALGTATVQYDVLRQPGPTCLAAVGGSPLTAAGCSSSQNNPFTTLGSDIPNGSLVIETQWLNGQNTYDPTNNLLGYGFYAPMFDVPANVIQQSELLPGGTALPGSSPISPINLFPWLEKLFVGMTTGMTTNLVGTFAKNTPSLWDFRPGDDTYDTTLPYFDPYTGVVVSGISTTAVCPSAPCLMIPFGNRGGASTDPNDGSLWLFGAFAKQRLGGVPGPGHWGTSIANYQLDFPATDPYGNDNTFFADVPTTNPYFTWIQIAKNAGIVPPPGTNPGLTTASGSSCPATNNTNPPILQPPSGGGSATPGTSTLTCLLFGPDTTVTRSEMARWIVLSQMDETQVNVYLAATGGFPGCNGIASTTATPVGSTTGTVTCNNGSITYSTGNFTVSNATLPNAGANPAPSCAGGVCTVNMNAQNSSFGDAPSGCTTSNTNCTSYVGILNDPNIRYIETLYRRGYTKGCSASDDPIRRFCGGSFLTRAQMAVFIIRAKMNNVFPTTLSGIPLCISQSCGTTYGDNFGLFLPATPYFPVDANGITDPTFGDYYIYIQKLRELRITNGVGGGAFGSASNITRKEVATFVIRAFFL